MATSGKYLVCTHGAGTTMHLGVTKWSYEDDGEELDDTDAETNGFTDTDVGVKGGVLTFDITWDTADGPVPAIRKGTQLTSVKAYKSSFDAIPDVEMPIARVMKRSRAVEVRGQIKFNVTIRNRGVFKIDGVNA